MPYEWIYERFVNSHKMLKLTFDIPREKKEKKNKKADNLKIEQRTEKLTNLESSVVTGMSTLVRWEIWKKNERRYYALAKWEFFNMFSSSGLWLLYHTSYTMRATKMFWFLDWLYKNNTESTLIFRLTSNACILWNMLDNVSLIAFQLLGFQRNDCSELISCLIHESKLHIAHRTTNKILNVYNSITNKTLTYRKHTYGNQTERGKASVQATLESY